MKPVPFSSSIVPVYYVNRLLGLAPYSRFRDEYRPNYTACLYTAVLIVLYWTSFTASIMKRFQDTQGELSIKTSTDYMQLSMGCFAQTVCWVRAMTTQTSITRSLKMMNGVDAKLGRLCDAQDYQISRERVWIQQVVIWALGIGCCVFINVLVIVNGSYMSFYYWTTYYGPLTGLWGFVSIYARFALGLRRRFKAVNRRLQKFRKTDGPHKPKIEFISGRIIQVMPAPAYGSKSISPIKPKNKSDMFAENTMYVTDAKTLDMISEIHDELCLICKKIMEAHGVQSLVSTAFVFVTITCQMFYMLVLSEAKAPEMILSSTIWLMFYTLPLIALCGACHFCAEEANNTGNILHNLQNYGSYNIDFKTTASLFSLQLIHQEIKFTAYGFFSIDFTLLQGILGAVTTYLVILLQFNAGFSRKQQQKAIT